MNHDEQEAVSRHREGESASARDRYGALNPHLQTPASTARTQADREPATWSKNTMGSDRLAALLEVTGERSPIAFRGSPLQLPATERSHSFCKSSIMDSLQQPELCKTCQSSKCCVENTEPPLQQNYSTLIFWTLRSGRKQGYLAFLCMLMSDLKYSQWKQRFRIIPELTLCIQKNSSPQLALLIQIL